LNGGNLTGSGTIQASLTNGATFNPTGILSITGSYTQTSSGILSIQAAGVAPGVDYGQLSVSGAVTLAGNIQFTPLFVGQTGDSFTLIAPLSTASISGTFNHLPEGGGVLAGGETYAISYLGGTGHNNVVLSNSPALSIDDVSLPQAASGTVNYLFTVTLNRPA